LHTIEAPWLRLALRFPRSQPFQVVYFPLQCIVLLLQLAHLVDGVPYVSVVQLSVGSLDLVDMLARVLQGQQRRGLEPALLGRGRQGAIGAGGIGALSPELLPHQAQEELPQRVGTQSSSIVCGGILDEAVALEGFGDAHEAVVFEAELGEPAEEQEGFERRVRCRRSIHAPDDCTPRGTEGTAAVLDEMNRRHDLRVATRSATSWGQCWARALRVLQRAERHTGSPSPRSYQLRDGAVSLSMNATPSRGAFPGDRPIDGLELAMN
jgi:hypothetical protein